MSGRLAENLDYLVFILLGLALFGLLELWLRRRAPRGSLPRVVWPALLAIWGAGWWLVNEGGLAEGRKIRDFLKGVAPTYAQELALMGHAGVTADTPPDDPAYLRMIEAQRRWVEVNPGISDLYTFRDSPEGIRLIVDSETDYDRDGKLDQEREQRTPIGLLYEQADEGMYRALRGEAVFTDEIVGDEWGVWVSAYVPLRDAEGRVEGALGVDYPAAEFVAAVAAGRERALWLLAVPVLILGFSTAMVGALRAENAARRGVERQLRESEAHLRTALDSMPFDFWVMDETGRLVLANATSRQHWGDNIGRTIAEMDVPADTRAMWERNHRRAFAGEVVRCEVMLEPGGSRRFFHSVTAPVRVGDRIVGILGLNVDLTDRVSAEEARRMSERRLALHVRQTPLAVVEWDTEFRVAAWNPAAERIFGFTAGEVLGRNAWELIVPEEAREQVSRVWQAILSRTGGTRSVNPNLTKDGRVILCDWHNTPLVDDSGRVIGVASHCEDITQRDTMERHLRQAQKIESLGQLAAGVAHEFNNLLTPMLLRLEMLRLDRAGDADLLAALRSIEDAIEQAAQLNQRILAAGRRSAEKREWLALNPIVDDTLALLRHTLDRRIALEVSPAPGLGPLSIDRAQVAQIVVNLTLNARDALLDDPRLRSGEGWTPRIRVSTEAVPAVPPASAGAEAGAPRACQRITVADNGPGMPEEVRARIFEPFYTTKTAGRGTGLGLAVVWNVVENHGGWIEVDSAPGQGAEFRVYLPAGGEGPEPAARAEPPTGVAARRPLRVLLVEDNLFVADTINHLLTREGHAVTYAANGEEAFALCARAEPPFELIVTDQNMPLMTGAELVRRLRAGGSRVPVIVVSGHLSSAIAAELDALGTSAVLAKPFTQRELLAAVAKVAAR